MKEPRVLIIGVDWLGDVLFSTPVIRSIRKQHPNAFIAYSTPRRCASAIQSNPHLDEVIAYDERPFLLNFIENIKFVKKLIQSQFDTAVFLHRSSTRAFLSALARIPQRIGFSYPKRNWLMTDIVHHNVDVSAQGRHRSKQYSDILKSMNVSLDGEETDFLITDDDRNEWNSLKESLSFRDSAYAVMHIGGNWGLKRWPLESFIQLGKFLETQSISIAICGTEKEAEIAAEYTKHIPQAVSFCGKTSIGCLAAMMDKSLCVISNDSGPIHVAAAIGKTLIGLYGPTHPKITGPKGKGDQFIFHKNFGCEVPCYFEQCHHQVCMQGITPEEVIEKLKSIIHYEKPKA